MPHPNYGLAIVLFGIILMTGVGSLLYSFRRMDAIEPPPLATQRSVIHLFDCLELGGDRLGRSGTTVSADLGSGAICGAEFRLTGSHEPILCYGPRLLRGLPPPEAPEGAPPESGGGQRSQPST